MTQYVPLIGLCVPSGRVPNLQGVFEAPLAFDVLLFILTAFKAWTNWRRQVNVASTPLLIIIYRGMESLSIEDERNLLIYPVQMASSSF